MNKQKFYETMSRVEQEATNKLVREMRFVMENKKLTFVSTYWSIRAETFMCRAFRRIHEDYYCDLNEIATRHMPINILHDFKLVTYIQGWNDMEPTNVSTLGLYQYAARAHDLYTVEQLPTILRDIRKQDVKTRVKRVLENAVNVYNTSIGEDNEPV